MGFDREDWEELKSDVSNTFVAIALMFGITVLLGLLLIVFFRHP